MRRVLDLEVRVPRHLLLYELGVQWRLQSSILLGALRLKARMDLLPTGHVCQRVGRVAIEHPGTWTATAMREMADLRIPDVVSWAQPAKELCKDEQKRLAAKFARKVVAAALHEREADSRATGATILGAALSFAPTCCMRTFRSGSFDVGPSFGSRADSLSTVNRMASELAAACATNRRPSAQNICSYNAQPLPLTSRRRRHRLFGSICRPVTSLGVFGRQGTRETCARQSA